MSATYSGKVALVTGGAAGIGRATALAFAAEGLQVVVSDLDAAGGEGTVELIRAAGGEAIFVRCDVSRDEQVVALMATIQEQYGRLDYAFNNAGIEIEKGKLNEGSEAEFDAIMGVNVKGVWLCMKHELPLLLAQGGGVIVNTASVAAFDGQVGQAAYASSKAGVVGLTLPVARELSRFGIRVMTIAPGIMETPMLMGMPQEVQDSLGKTVPFPSRMGKPAEFAALVRHIIENAYLNGEVIRLDGAIRMSAK